MSEEKFYETDYIRALDEDKELCIILLGKRYMDAIGACAILGEIISRKEGSCEYYNMGMIRNISCMDEESFTMDVDAPKAYIFKTWDVSRLPSEEQPILITGKAGYYNIATNSIGPLVMSLQFDILKVPEYKEKDSIEVMNVNNLKPYGTRLEEVAKIAADNDAILSIEDLSDEEKAKKVEELLGGRDTVPPLLKRPVMRYHKDGIDYAADLDQIRKDAKELIDKAEVIGFNDKEAKKE